MREAGGRSGKNGVCEEWCDSERIREGAKGEEQARKFVGNELWRRLKEQFPAQKEGGRSVLRQEVLWG